VRGAAAESPAFRVSDYLPVAETQGPEASPAEVAKALRDCAAELAAVLPPLSPAADLRINAVRERCDGLVKKAQRESDRLRTEAAGAYLNGDRKGAYALRRRAREVREAAGAQAAVDLLDAQAEQFLPLTGNHFPNKTLEVLAKTSIDLYGGAEAVADRMYEWRAQSLEAEAGHLTANATPAPASPDPFKSRDQREAAYQAAKAKAKGGRGEQLAADIGVEYTDLRKWVRVRQLAKGDSGKTKRIERNMSERAHVQQVS
jgi:uncharacterized membrane protein